MPKLIGDLTGKVFNRLTVIEKDETREGNYWICKCECGTIKSIRASHLVSNATKSCGCLSREKASINCRKIQPLGAKAYADKHQFGPKWWKKKYPKLFTVITNHWYHCTNPKSGQYHQYGAVGWHFADEWIDFENYRPQYDVIIPWCLEHGWQDGLVMEKDMLASMLQKREIGPDTIQFVTQKQNCQYHYKVSNISNKIVDILIR